jgi:hypothetical protein
MVYAMDIGVLLDMDILLLYCVPSAESFNFFTIFSQTRLVYPQLFYLFLSFTITTLPMINALDYVASDIILDTIEET